MDVIPKWSIQDKLLSLALQALNSSFALDISTWTILQTTCPNWAHHLFPITVHFPHQWLHLWCFRWPDQPLEGLVFSISTFYLLFFMSSMDLYLPFYCHHRMPPDYISFDSLGLFLLRYGCELISWNTILSMFFLPLSSNSLSLMNQVQILYLGIPSLFIFSSQHTLLLLGSSSYSRT